MSEHVKSLGEALVRLRNTVNTNAGMKAATDARRALDALLAEHRAEVSAARDAALEEATGVARVVLEQAARGPLVHAEREALAAILALQSAPAQVVPVAKVREATRTPTWTDDVPTEYGAGFREGFEKALSAVRKRLGVDLDATGGACGKCHLKGETCEDCARDAAAHLAPPATCPAAPRETASEENGLLPKARLCSECGHSAHNKRCAERLRGTSSGAVRICKCKRGVWRDVSDAAGSVK